jgi:HSP20 family protein
VVTKARAAFGGFTDLVSELNRLREIGRTGHDPAHGDEAPREYASAWVPTADIFARRDQLVIRIELPGMDPDDVDITYSSGMLTVSGERHTDIGAEDAVFYVRERYRGAFRRAMTLPEGTPASAISAEFHNGLVEITVQGFSADTPERIEIRDRSSGRTDRTIG